jgi:hypothetical protein
LFGRAFDLGARTDALTIAAELSVRAVHIVTRIGLTKAIDAALTIGASAQIAIIFEALAFFTEITLGAIDQFALIDTSTGDTKFIIGAIHFGTCVSVAVSVDTSHTTGTFEVATEQSTSALIADHAGRTRGVIIGYTVTIVVFAIADLWLRKRCITAYPLSILADFLADPTYALAFSAEAIIN